MKHDDVLKSENDKETPMISKVSPSTSAKTSQDNNNVTSKQIMTNSTSLATVSIPTSNDSRIEPFYRSDTWQQSGSLNQAAPSNASQSQYHQLPGHMQYPRHLPSQYPQMNVAQHLAMQPPDCFDNKKH